MIQRVRKTESACVPVPQMDAVVVASEATEGPVVGISHGPLDECRAELGRGPRQGRRRVWLSETAAREERDHAFPGEVAGGVHGGTQVELRAFGHCAPVSDRGREVERLVDADGSML